MKVSLQIKCDKAEKLVTQGGNQASIVCSACQVTGVNCESEIIQPRKRNGKRLREIREEEEEREKQKRLPSSYSSNHATTSTSSYQLQQSFDTPSSEPSTSTLNRISNYSFNDNDGEALTLLSTSSVVPSLNPPSKDSLFGVNGFTRPLLEACVAQFFISISPLQPLCHPDQFLPRFKSFLQNQQSLTRGETTASELTILAVACVGAGHLDFSNTSEGIVEVDLRRKFELREALYRAFRLRLHANGGSIIQDDPLDALEACYLMYTLENDLSENGLLQNSSDSNSKPPDESLLSIQPTTLAGVIKLLYDNGLNRQPKADLSTGDKLRHTRLFWASFIADSFYGFATRKPLLIAEDSFDVDLPKWLPSPNDSISITHDITNSNQPPLPPSWSKDQLFEMQRVACLLKLSFLTRDFNRPFVSTRAQSKGINATEVFRAIQVLRKWWNERPKEVIFDADNPERFESSRDRKDNSIWKRRLKCYYTEVSLI